MYDGPFRDLISAIQLEVTFSHLYFEGFDDYYKNATQFFSHNDSCLIPARDLVNRGCKLELTEHPGFNLLLVAYDKRFGGIDKSVNYLNCEVKGKQVEEIIEEVDEYSDSKELIKDFLAEEDNFDLERREING